MAVKDKGYARPELLVDTDWLQDRLLEPRIQLVDCGAWASYTRAHIPGAVGVRRDNYFKAETTGSTFIDTPEQFAEEMAGLGISDETQVVAYDDSTAAGASGCGRSAQSPTPSRKEARPRLHRSRTPPSSRRPSTS